MNRRSHSDHSGSHTLRDRLCSWRELAEQCGRKPTRKRVHALRVVTLRIQAEMEDLLSELPSASHERQAMLHFGKLAGKLRDALGMVRELDVWIGKLRRLRESPGGTAEYVPRSTRDTARQIERFETRLEKKRERAGMKLVAKIEKRWDALLLASREAEEAAGQRAHVPEGTESARLLKEFAGIAAHFPVFDERNLHDFRKRIKKIRYLAEIDCANPVCDHIAGQIKKAQDGIGEWHDWYVLARTAARGRHGKDAEAVELLGNLAAESYESAISTCHVVLRRIADLEQGGGAALGAARKQVHCENAGSASFRKLA